MKTFTLAAVLSVLASPMLAADLASGADIMSNISGNTVQGGMADGSAYTEFYEASGTIKGPNYTGTWTVEDDTMCFDYGEGKTCWGVAIRGDMVTWMNGETAEGTGTIVPGNPNGF